MTAKYPQHMENKMAEASTTRKTSESEPPDHYTDRTYGHSLPRTDLHLCRKNATPDPVTGLLLGPCSLALRYFLPLWDLVRSLHSQKINALSTTFKSDSNTRILVTGSSVEKLSVPPYCKRLPSTEEDFCSVGSREGISGAETSQTEPIVNTADVDVMYVVKELPVSPRFGDGMLYVDGRNRSHEGYVRIGVNPKMACEFANRRIDMLIEEQKDVEGRPVHYLSSDFFMTAMMDYHDSRDAPRIQGVMERHGPAINRIISQEDRQIDMDTVRALELSSQIPAIGHWIRRLQRSGTTWPPIAARRDILKLCRPHVVPTGHPDSPRRDLEWRLSFSLAERRLANCLTHGQRKVYVVIKTMQKCFLKTPKVLVTYHIKTLMFWQLEATSDVKKCTEEHLFERVLDVLSRLESCLGHHNIPSYFVPENNLISSVNAADVRELHAVVRRIRRNPLRTLYEIDKAFRFQFSTTEPLLHFHKPLVEVIEKGDVSKLPSALAASLVHQARDGMSRNDHTIPRCAELLRDAWEIQQLSDEIQKPAFNHWLQLALAVICLLIQKDEDAWVADVFRKAASERNPNLPVITDEHVRLVLDSWKDWRDSPLLGLIHDTMAEAGGGDLMRQIVEKCVESEYRHPPEQSLSLLFLLDIAMKPEEPSTVVSQTKSGNDHPFLNSAVEGTTEVSTKKTKEVDRARKLREDISEFVYTTFEQMQDDREASPGFIPTFLHHQTSVGVPYVVSERSDLEETLLAERIAGWDDTSVPKVFQTQAVATDCRLVTSLDQNISTMMAGPRYHAASAHSTFTPVLNTLGYLISHKQPWFILRISDMWSRFLVRPYLLDSPSSSVTYDLREASIFLSSLPEEIRVLLELTSYQARTKAIELMLKGFELAGGNITTLKQDSELPLKAETFAEDWDTLMWTLYKPACPSDVFLTENMLKLCSLRVLGGSKDLCMQCVEELGDDDVIERARTIILTSDRRYPMDLYTSGTSE